MYVYHRKPVNMEGDTLYPLNSLRSKFPNLYDAQAKKYEGREELMQRKIPILNCLWNDVIHLAPVHPKHVFENIRAAGGEPRPSTWFRFPVEVLQDKDVVYYLGPAKRSPSLDTGHFSKFQIV